MANTNGSSGERVPDSHSTCAVASVACPQRSTSTRGVNQRNGSWSAASSTTTKAVSERFISAATASIHASSRGASSTHTAAGLPRNGCSVKASTWKSAGLTR